MRRRLLPAALAVAILSVNPSSPAATDGDIEPPASTAIDAPWPMHALDSRYRGANALGGADVNGDGFTDYVTNYEFDQRYVISFHPGPGSDPRAPWPTVDLAPLTAVPGKGVDTENAILADVDGDGNLDVIGVQGGHETFVFDGYEPGVTIYWGPGSARTADPTAWVPAGIIPATLNEGHYHWLLPHDVNGDGALDILIGGRVLFTNGNLAGVAWIEAPTEAAARRNLAAWQLHDIDPQQAGGHGFELDDVDADGDSDLILANADFDTPEGDEAILWYENPGTGAPKQTQPWAKHEIYRGPEFFGKPQIAIADIDGDGMLDFVTQTPDELLVFRKTRTSPQPAWSLLRVAKDDRASWAARTIRIADLNGDGRLDIVGMLTHDDGSLPLGKASVFWMEYAGESPGRDNWTTHVVKWSPGSVMQMATFGEKWDQAHIVDVDDDGDLDIVANCEEWWQEDDGEYTFWWAPWRDAESVAVVWFENRLNEELAECVETDGRCEMDAETPTVADDGSWVERSRLDGAGDSRYVQAFNSRDPAKEYHGYPFISDPSNSLPPDCTVASCDLEWEATRGSRYRMHLDGGTYTIAARVLVPARFGDGLGSTRSDSMWIGLDANAPRIVGTETVDAWTWITIPGVHLDPGEHVVTLKVREHGVAVDALEVIRDM
ncbi:MAG: VCBS repeat-containing protein [Actinomycetota bacterium]